ncbi:TetR/AcrR family transcriptional regulator [Skermania sp. ID1734]|uniref:TetR/AcrR family transcriptional regulator n=1 Tax=Skermania sp. ID1734 TaxID=2597516 RepID=UPI0011804EDD|nr:TetR/AcrR family transcriptional regulator [Skermania sp. ID1734]TSD94448.1 TetR/AcrR family transcriptional regulator [Skermania sp. ID1734]
MPSKTWGGRTSAERKADRRARLIEAALAIWTESGWAAVTMRGVCAKAQLIDRYFYESFADRDELLAVVWDQIRDETTQMLDDLLEHGAGEEPFTLLRRGVAVLVEQVAEDPRRAHILFGNHAGSAVLEERRQQMLQSMTAVFMAAGRPYLRPDADLSAFESASFMFIGGFLELITAWRAGVVTADAAQIIEHAAWVGTTLGTPFLPEGNDAR